MTLAQDVHSGFHHELPLVRAGVRIEEQHKLALARAGVYAVYVDDELGDGIEVRRALSPETRTVAMSALVRTFAETAAHFTEGGRVRGATVLELTSAVHHICDDLSSADHAVVTEALRALDTAVNDVRAESAGERAQREASEASTSAALAAVNVELDQLRRELVDQGQRRPEGTPQGPAPHAPRTAHPTSR